MRILLDFRVPCVAEAHGLCQCIDLVFLAGKEMPALGGAGPAIALDVSRLRGSGVFRLVARINAYSYNVEFPANVEADDAIHRASKTVQYLRAQHWALVVHQHQNNGLLPEVLLQLDGLAAFVIESKIQRDLLVQALIEPNLIENGRFLVRDRVARLKL